MEKVASDPHFDSGGEIAKPGGVIKERGHAHNTHEGEEEVISVFEVYEDVIDEVVVDKHGRVSLQFLKFVFFLLFLPKKFHNNYCTDVPVRGKNQ